MSYKRTIPRDLFNEASLLKCYGKLWLWLENKIGKGVTFDFEDVDGQPFLIEQNAADGSLRIENVALFVNDRRIRLARPLNSRATWPLYAYHPDRPDDEIAVFDDGGALTPEMRNLVAGNLPEPSLYCDTCHRHERDPLFLDVETCSVCGGLVGAAEGE